MKVIISAGKNTVEPHFIGGFWRWRDSERHISYHLSGMMGSNYKRFTPYGVNGKDKEGTKRP